MLAIYILDIRIWMAIGTRLVWGTPHYPMHNTYHINVIYISFHIVTSFCSHRHNGSPLARSPSPRRRGHQYIHHDIGFSDTVSNVVEMVKETRHPRHGNSHPRYPRGIYQKFYPASRYSLLIWMYVCTIKVCIPCTYECMCELVCQNTQQGIQKVYILYWKYSEVFSLFNIT